jgi:hypothetical protein
LPIITRNSLYLLFSLDGLITGMLVKGGGKEKGRYREVQGGRGGTGR